MNCSPPDPSPLRILQARILEQIVAFFFRGSSWPRDWTHISFISCIGRQGLLSLHHMGSPFGDISATFHLPRIFELFLCNKQPQKSQQHKKVHLFNSHIWGSTGISCWRLISDGWISQSRETPTHNCGSAGDWLMWAWLGVSGWCHGAPHVCCPPPGTNGPAQACSFQSERTNAKVESQVHWTF